MYFFNQFVTLKSQLSDRIKKSCEPAQVIIIEPTCSANLPFMKWHLSALICKSLITSDNEIVSCLCK